MRSRVSSRVADMSPSGCAGHSVRVYKARGREHQGFSSPERCCLSRARNVQRQDYDSRGDREPRRVVCHTAVTLMSFNAGAMLSSLEPEQRGGIMNAFRPGALRKSMATRLIAVAAASVLSTSAFAAGQITGAGSTWVYPLVAKWAATYAQQTGVQVNYQPIGSGGGIQQIKAGTVAFGASDMPLTPDVLSQNQLIQFPTAIAGEDIVYNLPGVECGTAPPDGSGDRRHLSGQDHPVERSGDPEAESEPAPARHGDQRGASLRRLRHDLHVRRLSFQGEPGVEAEGRREHRDQLAGRYRRQGQSGRGRLRAAPSGLDRLRGVRVYPRELT